eukprot:2715689-Pleurochrysis_carterae.AAC.1
MRERVQRAKCGATFANLCDDREVGWRSGSIGAHCKTAGEERRDGEKKKRGARRGGRRTRMESAGDCTAGLERWRRGESVQKRASTKQCNWYRRTISTRTMSNAVPFHICNEASDHP